MTQSIEDLKAEIQAQEEFQNRVSQAMESRGFDLKKVQLPIVLGVIRTLLNKYSWLDETTAIAAAMAVAEILPDMREISIDPRYLTAANLDVWEKLLRKARNKRRIVLASAAAWLVDQQVPKAWWITKAVRRLISRRTLELLTVPFIPTFK